MAHGLTCLWALRKIRPARGEASARLSCSLRTEDTANGKKKKWGSRNAPPRRPLLMVYLHPPVSSSTVKLAKRLGPLNRSLHLSLSLPSLGRSAQPSLVYFPHVYSTCIAPTLRAFGLFPAPRGLASTSTMLSDCFPSTVSARLARVGQR